VAEAMLVSNIVLWVLVIVLALVVLALARQVGVLHERVAPAGALMPTTGPKVGELTEPLPLSDINGQSLSIGGPDANGLHTLVMFISPTCPVCKSLVPTAKSLANSERKRLQLVFASDGDKLEQHQAYARDLNLGKYPYVLSEKLGMSYEVSKLPFAILVGADGTLQSKGLVNTREHLESLIEAMDSGVATLQDYVGNLQNEHDHSVKEKAS
jgi:methylamine dehydrogenase accessory protein MauD|tara:strand:+ start:719 stop:1354 length:636 start_codon:yes stop_codon:yes gene_type:complete